jgi:hypothetical protein
MRILLYEDSLADQLAPVALLRPVFELICGRDSLRRRLQRWFPAAEFGAWIRPWMVDAYAAEQPGLRVNDPAWVRREPVLLINGRWRARVDAVERLAGGRVPARRTGGIVERSGSVATCRPRRRLTGPLSVGSCAVEWPAVDPRF